MTDDLDRELAKLVIVAIGERLRRSHHDRLASVDAERVEVLHVADGDAVVVAVAHHLILHFFPALETLLDKYLRREAESLVADGNELLLIVTETRAQATEGVCRTDDDRIAKVACSLLCLIERVAGMALDGVDTNLIETLHKEFAVFGVDDGLDRRTEHLHVVFLEHATLVELNSAVQCRLSAEAEQDAIGTFLLDDLLDEKWSDRQEIHTVGNAFRSLHCGNIRVNENALDAFFLQCLESL